MFNSTKLDKVRQRSHKCEKPIESFTFRSNQLISVENLVPFVPLFPFCLIKLLKSFKNFVPLVPFVPQEISTLFRLFSCSGFVPLKSLIFQCFQALEQTEQNISNRYIFIIGEKEIQVSAHMRVCARENLCFFCSFVPRGLNHD